MKYAVALTAVLALALSACADDGPAPDPGSSVGGTSSVAPASVEPVVAVPGLAELGLERATVSVAAQPGAVVDSADGLTLVPPADGEDVAVVHLGYDGKERWRHAVEAPDGDRDVRPRLRLDEGLGVVAVWFTRDSGSDNAEVVGDIHWYALDDGEGGTLRPERADRTSRVESWRGLVGYMSFPDAAGPSTSVTYLDDTREARTLTWSGVLGAGEQSWLTGVVDGRPVYSVTDAEHRVQLHQGDRTVLTGAASNTRWAALPSGVVAAVGVPGSNMVVVDRDGTVLLDHAGECRTGSAVVAHGTQIWSGALLHDVGTGTTRCVDAVAEHGAELTGMTPSGVALARASDGALVLSEPAYGELRETSVQVPVHARDGYLLVEDTRDDERHVVSVFRADDLTLH